MMIRTIILVMLLGLILLAGCGKITPMATVMATQTRATLLEPYLTATATITAAPVAFSTPVPLTPEPTATPFTHAVAQGETMLGIALRYGIKLEDLLAANPTINPRILSIGTLVVVPLPGGEVESEPTETPIPLPLDAPICYPAGDQGTWCAVYLTNDQDRDLENISAWMGLYVGEEIRASQTIVPPLNKLARGERAPLVAYFSGPIPTDARPRVEVLTAIPVASDDGRYLSVETMDMQMELLSEGRAARVKARVSWAEDQATPGSIWIALAAEDALGRLIGLRKLETRPLCMEGQACQELEVELIVFSLGPEITDVRLWVEARP